MLQITRKSCTHIQVKLTTPKIQGSDRILFDIFIFSSLYLIPHRKHDGTRGFKAFGDPIVADHFCDWKSRILWISGLSACFPPQVVLCLLKLILGQEDKTISFGDDIVVHVHPQHCFMLLKILRKMFFLWSSCLFSISGLS